MSLVTLHYTFNQEFCCVNLGLISILLQPRGKLKLFFNVMALLQRFYGGVPSLFWKININRFDIDVIIYLFTSEWVTNWHIVTPNKSRLYVLHYAWLKIHALELRIGTKLMCMIVTVCYHYLGSNKKGLNEDSTLISVMLVQFPTSWASWELDVMWIVDKLLDDGYGSVWLLYLMWMKFML